MLIADFTNYGEEITVDGLWQYDYGQRLQINGLNLPDVFEVHLFWKGLEEAKVVTGYTENNKFYVDIPNESLKQRQAITVYIYLSTPETGKTVNTVMMFVNKRPEPEGFEIPEDIDLFHHTLAAVGEYTRQTKEAAQMADARATESESWAHGHKLIQNVIKTMQSIMQIRQNRLRQRMASVVWNTGRWTSIFIPYRKYCTEFGF